MPGREMYSVLVVNGPNLKYTGLRDAAVYGTAFLGEIPGLLAGHCPETAQRLQVDFFQSNSEGGLVDRLERAWEEKTAGVVINPGAYTHTSLALADCLGWISIPFVEVHLSNIWSRDRIRQHSHTARHALGVIAGFGIMGYVYGLKALADHLQGSGN